MGTYEVREYPATNWVSTDGYEMDVFDAEVVNIAFDKLFQYIAGNNADGVKIEMTAPVTTWIRPGIGPNCESNFTMSFFIPSIYQDEPIAPMDPTVYIEQRPAIKVLSRRFSGSASGEKFRADTYYTAGYDSPF